MSADRYLNKRQGQAQYLAAKSAERINRRRAKGCPQWLCTEAFELMLRLDRIGWKGMAPR